MDKPDINSKAKSLRHNATPEENKLWYKFFRTCPVRFHRQKVIGKYIVDFCFYKAHLVIELDWGQQFEKSGIKHDDDRTNFLFNLVVEVLRITNEEIRNNFSEVYLHLDEKVRALIGRWK